MRPVIGVSGEAIAILGKQQANERRDRNDQRERELICDSERETMGIHHADPNPHQHADIRTPKNDERQGRQHHRENENVAQGRWFSSMNA
jgi:hypothetical protein